MSRCSTATNGPVRHGDHPVALLVVLGAVTAEPVHRRLRAAEREVAVQRRGERERCVARIVHLQHGVEPVPRRRGGQRQRERVRPDRPGRVVVVQDRPPGRRAPAAARAATPGPGPPRAWAAAPVPANCGKITGMPPRIASPGPHRARGLSHSRSRPPTGVQPTTWPPCGGRPAARRREPRRSSSRRDRPRRAVCHPVITAPFLVHLADRASPPQAPRPLRSAHPACGVTVPPRSGARRGPSGSTRIFIRRPARSSS